MSDREATRERGRDPSRPSDHPYEVAYGEFLHRRELAASGRIVIKASETPWQVSRQGKSKYLLADLSVKDTALRDWMVFQKDVLSKAEARHVHQGGLVIYVTRGRGHSIVDGERVDWKEGDLLVLPIQPGGVDHQHFNDTDGDETPQWAAFVYLPFMYAMGSLMTQKKEADGWREKASVVWDE